MHKSSKVKISLFSGGTGNDRFVSLIKSIPGTEIDIIVNSYRNKIVVKPKSSWPDSKTFRLQ